uniref:CS domain-containing protein n=1 Tax=Ciona savignyi TaxID=51511 RepID=H2ZDK3_CIOSA
MPEVQCYNKSCGVKYDPELNSDGACQHHPGNPVFHDALKGWGCTNGKHSNAKPKAELKPEVKTVKTNNVLPKETIVTPPPKPITNDVIERPSVNEPLTCLPVKTTASYDKGKAAKIDAEKEDGEIKVGTKCRNGGCDEVYANAPCDEHECTHHPGKPVFHDGMKYWSCCQRKTSDFTAFLSQEGCSKGKHLWRQEKEEKTVCRIDWHQTGPNVILSIFAKYANAETSKCEINQVYLKAHINYEGNKQYDLRMNLHGVVDPKLSKVTISGTKIEVTLRKRDAMHWKTIGEIEEDETEEIEKEEKKE